MRVQLEARHRCLVRYEEPTLLEYRFGWDEEDVT